MYNAKVHFHAYVERLMQVAIWIGTNTTQHEEIMDHIYIHDGYILMDMDAGEEEIVSGYSPSKLAPSP